ncbi:MAG TPA: DUF2268 domain-containing putative Zn-dependent protease [Aggregatilinea sp.]|jgi:hypothetical protein|uniref:gliding motility protein GldB-related protein n=1 Tax=Aggregatilinea sp. TaxID=2806333 RepID=UPI002CE41830|nr:DUF2268 domain-containing putative Zn-dependent protease [Aggregatilinea sp.]HML24058.1 DUF2268 domain-containing putative Zn-dependent protease [Aggregatilinea sp.]
MRAWTRRAGGAVIAGLVLALGAAGCSGTEESPKLVAIPTRTPVPATEEAAGETQDTATVISLDPALRDFMGVAMDASPLDRLDLFREQVMTPVSQCFDGSFWPDWNPEQLLGSGGIGLVSMDLQRWLDLLDSFPNDVAVSTIEDALAQTQALLPMEQSFTFCLLPLPLPMWYDGPAPEDQGPVSEVQAQILASNLDLIAVICTGSDICLDRLSIESMQAYGMLYQAYHSGKNGAETSLLDMMIRSARAAYLVRQIQPDAAFPWDGALTADQEAMLWGSIQDTLAVTYGDYPQSRNIDRVLQGTANTARYPTSGGYYLGEQIVQTYISAHPDVSLAELFALDPEALLAESGYAPEAPPTQEAS